MRDYVLWILRTDKIHTSALLQFQKPRHNTTMQQTTETRISQHCLLRTVLLTYGKAHCHMTQTRTIVAM